MTTTAHPDDHRRRTMAAIALTASGYAAFNIGDAVVKVLSAKFSWAQIMVVNGLLIVTAMVAYGLWREGMRTFRAHNPRWVAMRALFSVGTTLSNIVALPHIRLTTFYTIIFTSPFWVALLSAVFLGEKLERRRLAVILSGFAVIAYIMRPGGEIFNVWSLMVLASAFLYSCSVVTMRWLGTRESRVVIISSGSLMCVAMALPFAWGHFLPLTLADAGLFALMGGTGALGIAFIAYAFQTSPSAAVIAPFHYTQMVWGALLGYVIFAEVPDMPTMAGAGLLIAGGLLLIWMETRALRVTAQAGDLPFRAGGWFSRLRAYSPSPKER